MGGGGGDGTYRQNGGGGTGAAAGRQAAKGGPGTAAQSAADAAVDYWAQSMMSADNADRLADALCRMRGAALKLGQLLSIYDDSLIPPQLQRALERVRAAADIMPAWQLKETIDEAVGGTDDWRELLDDFEEQPMAAASIGQVHLGELKGAELAGVESLEEALRRVRGEAGGSVYQAMGGADSAYSGDGQSVNADKTGKQVGGEDGQHQSSLGWLWSWMGQGNSSSGESSTLQPAAGQPTEQSGEAQSHSESSAYDPTAEQTPPPVPARVDLDDLGGAVPVAVKIQYPGVARSIDSDLDNLSRLLVLAGALPKGLFIDHAMDVARAELKEECDYRLEAAHQARFARMLRADRRMEGRALAAQSWEEVPRVAQEIAAAHDEQEANVRHARSIDGGTSYGGGGGTGSSGPLASHRAQHLLRDTSMRVIVPPVVRPLSSETMLTGVLAPGEAIDKAQSLDQTTRDRLGTALLRVTVRQLLQGYIQTDAQFGNYLYHAGSDTMTLLDFGATRAFSLDFVDGYLQVVWACAQRDREGMIRWSTELGFLTGRESRAMIEASRDAGLIVGEPFAVGEHECFDFGATDMTKRVAALGEAMARDRLAPPPREAYSLHRCLSGAFLACMRLRARVPARGVLVEALRDLQSGDLGRLQLSRYDSGQGAGLTSGSGVDCVGQDGRIQPTDGPECHVQEAVVRAGAAGVTSDGVQGQHVVAPALLESIEEASREWGKGPWDGPLAWTGAAAGRGVQHGRQ